MPHGNASRGETEEDTTTTFILKRVTSEDERPGWKLPIRKLCSSDICHVLSPPLKLSTEKNRLRRLEPFACSLQPSSVVLHCQNVFSGSSKLTKTPTVSN
ncbi:hypothetical protein RUM43_001323 [Polyplax serrata]|uniref:Uncharacterized protein n=1 Tax=Polyplax serrata TaxID=468196 RepID=A0AAN8SE75_POLSC